MANHELAAAKAALRTALLTARTGIPTERVARASASLRTRVLALPSVRQAACVFVYVSMLPEAGTRELIDRLRDDGKIVLVPKIVGREPMRAVLFTGWESMAPGVLGIPSPVHTSTPDCPVDVALIPGLAFTAHGERLGYGAGYYDRWLADHPETLRVALALEHQVLDELPVGMHDVSMDLIVTDERLLVPAGSRATPWK